MNRERLKTGLEKMGVAADETALERFEAFHAILDEYNARMDLTAVLDEDERVDRHDLDSAAPLAHGLLAEGAKGGTVRGTVDAPIPGRDDWAHVLLITDKTGATPKTYPRKAGTPGKKPLGK